MESVKRLGGGQTRSLLDLPGDNFGPGRELQLTGDNHGFAGLDAFCDDSEIALSLPRFYLAQLQRRIGLHHEDIRPVLTDLNRAARHEFRILQHVQNQTNVHELRRPERTVGVWCHAPQLDRAGAWLHGVVDKIESARARRDAVVSGIGHHLQVWIIQIAPNEWKVGLGDRKVGVDRVHPHDRKERYVPARGHHVPDVDVAHTGPAFNGRFDVAMVEIYLSRRDRGLRSTRAGLRRVPFLGGGDVLRAQLLLTLQGRLIQGQIRLGAGEGSFIRPRIDPEKQIAFLHVRAVLEFAGNNLTAYLGLNLDRFVGGSRANFVEIKGNILLDHLRYLHRPRRGGWRGLRPADKGPDQQEQDNEGNDPSDNLDAL